MPLYLCRRWKGDVVATEGPRCGMVLVTLITVVPLDLTVQLVQMPQQVTWGKGGDWRVEL